MQTRRRWREKSAERSLTPSSRVPIGRTTRLSRRVRDAPRMLIKRRPTRRARADGTRRVVFRARLAFRFLRVCDRPRVTTARGYRISTESSKVLSSLFHDPSLSSFSASLSLIFILDASVCASVSRARFSSARKFAGAIAFGDSR